MAPRQATLSGTNTTADGMVVALDTLTKNYVYASFIGGDSSDFLNVRPESIFFSRSDAQQSVVIRPNGNVVMSGMSDSVSYPVTNPYQATLRGSFDIIVTEISSVIGGTLGELLFSTYLGGSGDDKSYVRSLSYLRLSLRKQAVALSPDGAIVVGGQVQSNDFPLVDPDPSALGTSQGATLSLLLDSSLVYSTAFGPDGSSEVRVTITHLSFLAAILNCHLRCGAAK